MVQAPAFKRPSGSAPTQHLRVADVRGVPLAELQALFQAGAANPSTVELHMPAPMQRGPADAAHNAAAAAGEGAAAVASTAHCFVSFGTVEEAMTAAQRLTEQQLHGRVLSVKFAEVVQPKVLHTTGAQPPSVATAAEQLSIPGLQLLHEFCNPAEEAALLEGVDSRAWVALAKRRVQHYGYAFDYAKRGVETSRRLGPLPAFLGSLLSRIQALPEMPTVDQCTVNEYTPGVGLAAHIDTHSAFTGAILSLSLAGPCVMELRQGSEKRALLLPARSLLVLGGEARYAWQHYIPHRHSDVVNGISVPRAARRVSLTLRQVRDFACDCAYPEHCDSQQGVLPPTRLELLQQGLLEPTASGTATEITCSGSYNGLVPSTKDGAAGQPQSRAQPGYAHTCQEGQGNGSDVGLHQSGTLAESPEQSQQLQHADAGRSSRQGQAMVQPEAAAEQLEAQHVHRVYDAIASHFSATRFAVWPKVRAFIESLPANCIIADVGCGNGKYFGVRADCAVLGSDMSSGLAEVATRRLRPCGIPSLHTPQADVLVADALQLPYRDACCDAVLCIAVLHHISSMARRLRLLQELARVLRPGGQGLVTVWATEQEEPSKTLAKWTLFDNPSQTTTSNGSLTGKVLDGAVGGRHSDNADAAAEDETLTFSTGAIGEEHNITPAAGSAQGLPSAAACGGGSSSSSSSSNAVGPDYMVPWHLPLHRAGAVLAKASARQPDVPITSVSASSRGGADVSGSGRLQNRQQSTPLGVLDPAKNALVLQRYYHLFEPGELERLVARVPGLVLLRSYYDRSNWCAIFERKAAAAALL